MSLNSVYVVISACLNDKFTMDFKSRTFLKLKNFSGLEAACFRTLGLAFYPLVLKQYYVITSCSYPMGLTPKAFLKTQKDQERKLTAESQFEDVLVPVPFLHNFAEYPLHQWAPPTSPCGKSFCCVSECFALTMAAGLLW